MATNDTETEQKVLFQITETNTRASMGTGTKAWIQEQYTIRCRSEATRNETRIGTPTIGTTRRSKERATSTTAHSIIKNTG